VIALPHGGEGVPGNQLRHGKQSFSTWVASSGQFRWFEKERHHFTLQGKLKEVRRPISGFAARSRRWTPNSASTSS